MGRYTVLSTIYSTSLPLFLSVLFLINFASIDYITPIQGYKKEIEILNDKEAIELERYLRDKEDGTDISPGLFRVWLQKTLAKTDLPKVTLHSLRHTNITLQLVAGVDMKTVSARAGHSKASTTSDFYSHFIKNSDIHASEIINKIFE